MSDPKNPEENTTPVSGSGDSAILVPSSNNSSIPKASSSIDMPTPSHTVYDGLPYLIICTIKLPRHLRVAMRILTDPEFNSSGSARIDVDGSGFNMTVENLEASVVAHLFLNPTDFRCAVRVRGMKVNLNRLSYMLVLHVDDELHLHLVRSRASGELEFFLPGQLTLLGNSIELVENLAEIRPFPKMCVFSKATVSSEDKALFVQSLLQEQSPHRASVEFAGDSIKLKVESDNSLEAMQQANDGREVGPGDRYCASFRWTSAHLLLIVSWLDSNVGFLIRFYSNTPKCFLLRFNVPGKGCLEFMKEVREPNPPALSV